MLSSGTHVRFRIDGVLREIDLGALQEICDRGGNQIISRIKILAKLDIAERRRPQDGAFRARIERKGETENIDFRVSIIPGYYGESCVLRILDKKNAPTSLDKLGFSPAIRTKFHQLLKRPAGIMLVAGPTGSGKSTTLYASLMAIYRPEIRVLTAEDPIEYVYDQFTQSEVNERVGNTFARYLRAFLRHDPEVILVGEIRDEETAEMAFRAAQTGHLLLSTLHSNDAISAVPRLLDLKVDPNLVASSLLGVLAQRLVRCVCPECRQTHEPPPELVREFFPTRPEGLTFYQGAGCRACNFTGYRGRTCIAELWAPDAEDALLISKSASFDELRTSANRTTVSMAQDVMDRLVSGRTTLEELIRLMPYSSVHQFRQLVAAGVVGVTSEAVGVPSVADAEADESHAGEAEQTTGAAEPEPEARVLALEPKLEPAGGEAFESCDVPAAAEPTFDETPAAEGGPEGASNDQMIEAFRQLDQARSLTEVLNVLADHAAAETGRVAILTVANSQLRVRTRRGWQGADSGAIDVPIVPDTVFDLAIKMGRPVSTSEAPVGSGGDALSTLLAGPAGDTGLAVPIVVGGRTVAILYADQAGARGAAGATLRREPLEMLVRHAGWCLEVLTKSTATSGV
jgi:type II secretory ATPase GspE/PulE/Tfp pilus assembly ATPase PilB-like protein